MKSKFILMAAGVLAAASAWMPWISALGQTQNGFLGETRGNPGLFFVVFGVIIATMGLINKKASAIVAMLFALMVVGLGFKYYGDGTTPDAVLVGAKVGYGIYAMMLAGIAGIAGGIMRFTEKKASVVLGVA